MARKNRNFEVENALVVDLDSKGRGVVKHDDKVIFVPDTCPGDTVHVKTFRKKKSFFEGMAISIKTPSEDRVDPFCIHFDDCGGCKLQHVSYEKQLAFKEKSVRDAIERIAKVPYDEFEPILGCEQTSLYRNKLEFSASDSRWITKAEAQSSNDFKRENGLGFHVPGRFDKILHVTDCHFQPEPSNSIRNTAFAYAEKYEIPFYNPKTHEGVFRSVLIRNNHEGDFMVVVMVTSKGKQQATDLLNHLQEQFPQIKSGQYILNDKVNDTIYDLHPQVVFGDSEISQKIGRHSFKVDPKSFMQTNTQQTIKLYDVAKEYAQLKGDEVLYDLFCGVGTIGMYLSDTCKEVIGIETVPEAIEKAKENAVNNGVNNIRFETGSVEHVLTEDFKQKYPLPNVVICDPPRMGMHAKVITALLEMQPERIVYVSCNPSTQARDIALLNEKYHLKKIKPVDMFPHTPHIESVALLELKTV